MVAEGVVARRGGDALLNSNPLSDGAVGNAYVDVARSEVLNAVGGVARVPLDPECFAARRDAVLDEGIGKSYLSRTTVLAEHVFQQVELLDVSRMSFNFFRNVLGLSDAWLYAGTK